MNLSFPEIEQVYRDRPELAQRPYAEQKETLFAERYMMFNRFGRLLASHGHEVHEILYNLEPLQTAWAREHNHRFDRQHWRHDILLKQIEVFQPEIVYFQDPNALPVYIRRYLKRFQPSISKVVLFLGSFHAHEEIQGVDLTITCTPALQEWFSRTGIPCRLLYHGFDRSVLDLLGEVNRERRDFTFVGSSGFGYGSFQSGRYWLLSELAHQTDVELWLREPRVFEARVENFSYPPGFQPMEPLYRLFPGAYQGKVFGLDMYRTLAESCMTLNKHGEVGPAVGNLRLFEATGVGTCLITEDAPNLKDLFEPDAEVVAYCSLPDLLHKLTWLRSHPDSRRAIADAGHRRTLRDHSLENRCEVLNGYLQELV
jgi:hypothetical protein